VQGGNPKGEGNMNIPYARQWIEEDDIEIVNNVLKGDWLTQGPTVDAFEQAIAKYVGAKYCVAFNSGTAALHAAMYAAGVQPGDEVITTPITFVATANSVLYLGGKPKFVDIDPETGCIDISKIESIITPSTKVIAPVDYAGYPVDISTIMTVARKRGIVVVEDAAHALGAERNGRKVGTQADMTMFSFHPVKHVTTGEGGVITTENESFYKKMKIFRTHGITKDPEVFRGEEEGPWYYEMQILGYNYRITDFQCALGISQLNKLSASLTQRRRIADSYYKALGSLKGISLPALPKNKEATHAFHLFPILFTDFDRKAVFLSLKEKGIHGQVHYIPVHLQPFYRDRFGYQPGDFPNAESFYKREISIPMFPKMSDQEVEYVISCIQSICRRE
jgi:UDP-4-amino-4,6-dideoxy-N-acetyl-beta-L-altrosamine transaminase